MATTKVGVVGCGQMGRGIAQVSAEAGYSVVISETSKHLLQDGMQFIESVLAKDVSKGKITPADKAGIMSRITTTTDLSHLGDCDFVIEAVTEDIGLKQRIFAELDRLCPEHTILASNTSCLSIIDIAGATNRLDRVLGMHFTNPVPVNRLLEIVASVATSGDTLEKSKQFGKSLGQTIVVAPDTPGFITNRFLFAYLLEAVRMLAAKIGSKEDIDTVACKGLKHPMGPFALLDLIGIDTAYRIASSMYDTLKDPVYAPPPLLKQMVAAGWLGLKSGKGFYEYR